MILVTAFNKFGNSNINSSEEALKKASLQDDIIKAYLPVDEIETNKVLNKLIDDINPSLLIMFGQSGKSKDVKIETRAHNLISIPNIDNIPRKIDEEGRTLATQLDAIRLSNYLNSLNINTSLSADAGKYICNYSYYIMLRRNVKTIFIHLPYVTGQSMDPSIHSLDLLTLTRTIEFTLRYFKVHKNDY